MKKWFSLMLAMTLVVAMIAGCASGGGNNGNKEGAGGNKGGETTNGGGQEPAPQEVDKSSFKGEVEIALPAGDYIDYVKRQIKPYFEQEYPNVTVKVSEEGGTDKLMARVAAGDAPDVYAGVFGYQPAQLAKMGKIAELEELPGSKELIDRINPIYIHEDFGHLYYIPWNATTQLMIYNKELFKEAGLDPEAPPKTYDEFLQAAEKISKLPARANGEKVYGTIFWNDALNWGGWYWTMLAQMYYNFNDGQYQLFNKLGSDIAFDKPEAKMTEFLAFLQKAQSYAPQTMEKNFFNRNVGMWLQYGYGWKTNLKTAKDKPMEIGKDVGVAPLPVAAEGQKSWSTLDGRSLMIFKSNPEQEKLAWELIQYLMRDDKNLEANKTLGQLPTLKAQEKDPYFQLPENKVFVDQLQNTLMNEPIAELDQVSNEIQKVILKVTLEKKLTPEAAVKEAAANARNILKGTK